MSKNSYKDTLSDYNRASQVAYDWVVRCPLDYPPENRVNPWAMSKAIYQTNKVLNRRITNLEKQVKELTDQVKQLKDSYQRPILTPNTYKPPKDINPLYGPFGPVTAQQTFTSGYSSYTVPEYRTLEIND